MENFGVGLEKCLGKSFDVRGFEGVFVNLDYYITMTCRYSGQTQFSPISGSPYSHNSYIIRFAKKPWCSKTNLPSHSRYIIKGWNLRLIILTMHHFRKFSTRISRIEINKIHIKNIKKTLIKILLKYSNWLQL